RSPEPAHIGQKTNRAYCGWFRSTAPNSKSKYFCEWRCRPAESNRMNPDIAPKDAEVEVLLKLLEEYELKLRTTHSRAQRLQLLRMFSAFFGFGASLVLAAFYETLWKSQVVGSLTAHILVVIVVFLPLI